MAVTNTLGASGIEQPSETSLNTSSPLDIPAQGVSVVFSPPTLVTAELLVVSPNIQLSIVPLLIIPILLSCLFVLSLRLMRKVSSIELVSRRERLVPSLFASASGAALLAALYATGSNSEVRMLAAAVTVQLVILTAVTIFWKISYHAATAGTLLLSVMFVGSPQFVLPVAALALAVCWARVHLRRHTPAQVAMGMASALPLVLLVAG